MKTGYTTIITLAAAAGLGGWFFYSSIEKSHAPAGSPIVQVTVPVLSADEKEGEALFNANCAACHGENAAGREGSGPPFVHIVYQTGHHGDAAFYLAVQNGAISHHWPFGNMPPVDGVSEADVAKIVTYVRALQRANGIH